MSEPIVAGVPAGLRVAVTAGAAGIGRTIAETLLNHDAAVHVCDVDENALAQLRSELPQVKAMRADVADVSQVDRFFDAVLDDLGGLDVLVNNAGIAGPTGAVDAISVEDWDRTVAINLNGQFYCARRAVPALRESSGAMINLSSVAGRLGFPYRAPYAATKWAIVGFTRSLAQELGPDGVRVNAIMPGVVEGARIENVLTSRAETLGVPYDKVRHDALKKVSLRRMVSAQDIANMVIFLCSAAGANISGQSLSVCGNVEAL